MLVGERVIYLQLQKTGSTRITDLIQATVGAEERHKHDRIRREDLADPEIAARRILGSIRSPWSYYVSLWAYGSRRAGGIYERTTATPRMDQARALRGTLHKKTIPLEERDRKSRRRVKKWNLSGRRLVARRPECASGEGKARHASSRDLSWSGKRAACSEFQPGQTAARLRGEAAPCPAAPRQVVI